MKTPVLLALVVAFLTFSEGKSYRTNNGSADEEFLPAYCNEQGITDFDVYPPLGDRLYLRDEPFSNFKLSVKKYFIPENALGIDNTGVILFYLEDNGNSKVAGDASYTRAISFVSASIGVLSLQFSYNPISKDLELKADVADALGAVEHLFDCSFNVNPCTAEPIASLLATIRNTFGTKEC